MKIAGVVVANRRDDILYWNCGVRQQIGCLFQTSCLQQFFECLSGVGLDKAGQLRQRLIHLLRESGQGCIFVMLLNVAQNKENLTLLILHGISSVNAVGVVEQMQKQKPHCDLIQMSLGALRV